ncbi:hypothetical protein QQP08_002028 [Theobroma cacao]|nr:hypothetical protein QQP08_002028 [Theobroma cacao]
MDNFPKVLCEWSWEENKLFELALALVDEQHPDRWEVVAAMVGGEKSAEEVEKHYVILLEDLQFIESGKLDHKLVEAQSCIQVDCNQSVCWTDEDNKIYFSLASSVGHQDTGFKLNIICGAKKDIQRNTDKFFFEIGYWWLPEPMSRMIKLQKSSLPSTRDCILQLPN